MSFIIFILLLRTFIKENKNNPKRRFFYMDKKERRRRRRRGEEKKMLFPFFKFIFLVLIGCEWRERGGSPRAAEKVAVVARHGDAAANKSSARR